MPSAPTSEPRTLVTHPELKSHHSFPAFRTVGEAPKSVLERALSVFADVRAGEGVSALLLAANVFLLLSASYLLRNARIVLILTEGRPFGWSGAQLAAYCSAAMAVLLVGVIPLYGWLATRVPRFRLITITTVFIATTLVLFFLAGRAGLREGAIFYIWFGILNLFIVAQFWAFANDIYTEGQGRRLFPMIGVGASIGALFGAVSVRPLVAYLQFTPFTLMLVAAIVLLMALGLTFVVNQREARRADPLAAQLNEKPLDKQGGFELILKDRYLKWIALLTVLLNVVNSTGQYMLNTFVESQAALQSGIQGQQQFVSLFQSSFDSSVALLGVVLQLFVTSRALRFFGVRGSLFILPLLALVNYAVIAVAPILALVRAGKILENSTDYSIQNTLRAALFLPTTREAKYKAKAAIDTFCTRLGDLLYAGVVDVGIRLNIGVPGFAWLNVLLTVAWLAVAGQIAKEHRRRTV